MKEAIESQYLILAVDDDEQIRDILFRIIGLLGHTCVTAVDGLDALDRLTKSQFDIVVTDIQMPRMDGIELIKRIASDFSGVDVIAITGYKSKYKYTAIIELGASDFISKPFSTDKLMARINKLIRERALREQLKNLSTLDGLTDLYNRRHFDENLRREASRALRQKYDLYLLLIDVDSFKGYNDEFGHQQGDNLLQELANTIRISTRKDVDSGHRYGGDEFAVIIPHVNQQQALMVAERLRRNYNERNLAPTSLSMGLAKLVCKSQTLEKDSELLIKEADRALYSAKKSGGDMVCLATTEQVTLPDPCRKRSNLQLH